MPRSNEKYALLLQKVNGGSPKIVFEITHAKAQKIIDLIQPEIEKKKKKFIAAPITLDRFFED